MASSGKVWSAETQAAQSEKTRKGKKNGSLCSAKRSPEPVFSGKGQSLFRRENSRVTGKRSESLMKRSDFISRKTYRERKRKVQRGSVVKGLSEEKF